MKPRPTSLGKYQIFLLYFINQLTEIFVTDDSVGDCEEHISSTDLCDTCQPTVNKQITKKLPPRYNRLPKVN